MSPSPSRSAVKSLGSKGSGVMNLLSGEGAQSIGVLVPGDFAVCGEIVSMSPSPSRSAA